MAKLHRRSPQNGEGKEIFFFHCPGCESGHAFYVGAGSGPRWTFDGNMERPTFSPSLVNRWDQHVCHLFLRDGRIQFLSDCTHALAGQTVDLPDLEEPAA